MVEPRTPRLPAIADTAAAQARYMAAIATALAEHRAEVAPAAVVIDIAHAVAVIGSAVARADQAYIAGLKDGKRAALAAARIGANR